MANKNATGKSVSSEESIITSLKELVNSDSKVYYILWKYAPELIPKRDIKTFEDLKSKYKCLESDTYTESFCNNWLAEQKVQTAVKWLLQRLSTQKRIELYLVLFNQAKGGDVQSLKAFFELDSSFFDDKGENEAIAKLHGIDLNEEDYK